MVDAADLKALPDLDLTVYTTLASAFRSAAGTIWGQNKSRQEQVIAAASQWQGQTQKKYIERFEVGFKDGAEICGALHQAAAMVDGNTTSVPQEFAEGFRQLAAGGIGEKNLLAVAKRENQRRQHARKWLKDLEHYRNNDSVWDSFKDAIGLEPDWEDVIGPMPAPVEEPFLEAPTAQQRGGGGGGRNRPV
ncbi:MAG TPA: hypothetical protein VIL36_10520 [Acidimicrobiales bacterium]